MKISVVIAALSLGFGALSAHGQAAGLNDAITAYNHAVSNGSPAEKVVSARRLGAAVLQSRDRKDAALLAYEAGQTLCVFAGCDGAVPLADFAADKPLPADTVRSADVSLLSAYAAWTLDDTRSNRAALDDALDILQDADASLLTITAFQARYAADAAKQDWGSTAKSSTAAAMHLEPFRSVVGQIWSDAKIVSITSSFNDDPDTDQPLAMARHRVEIAKMRAASTPAPAWLDDHFYLTDAWKMAMSAYFHSGGGRRLGSRLRGPDPEKLDAEIAELEAGLDGMSYATSDREGQVSTAETDLPFCEGHLDMKPRLRYPGSAAMRGKFGSVIVSFSINNRRKVEDVEVLAAIPSATFEKTARETVEKWQWIVDEGVPGTTCRTNRSNIVLPILFALEG